MSFLSDTFKRYKGQYRTGASKPAHETDRVRVNRSLDIPRNDGTKELVGNVKDELARTADALESIKSEVAGFEGMQNAMKDYLDEQKKDTAETIHTENVKVYRNVQAVVVDETAKVKEEVGRSSSKAKLAMIFAILAFGVALIHFVFDILVYLGVL